MHAQVYLCYKKEDESRQPFAVKVTREDDEEKKMAHRKEFAITHGLDHPNIVKSLELFDNELKGLLAKGTKKPVQVQKAQADNQSNIENHLL